MTISKSNPRARQRWVLLTAVVVGLSLAGAALTFAVHNDGLFELGPSGTAPFTATTATNILGDGAVASGPDWGDLFSPSTGFKDAVGAGGTGAPNGIPDYLDLGGSAAGFIHDPSSAGSASDPSTFSGFGTSNKNTDPVSTGDCASRTPPLTGSTCTPWGWDSGNVPAKDDLTNVYSYATIPSSGPFANKLILYAGIERESPSGDSHVDIEFFQDQVGLCTTPDCTSFLGQRTTGDVIVSMDFLQGGALGSVTVREWDSALNTYVQEGVAAGVGCNTGDTICAFNNEVAIANGGWTSFDNHGASIITLPTNAFTEVGVDVTDLFGGTTPCISTFMAKTRSSASFTSELKDFAGPQAFPLCSAQISISPTATNKVGDNHTFNVTVQQKIGTAVSSAPDGTKPAVTLTATNGAVVTGVTDDCATTGTVGGTCSVTFTSNSAGQVTGSATATFLIGGDSFTVTTDGTGTNSAPAVKTFVDGKISIGPSATNGIGENHTFTITVQQDDGRTAAQGGDGVTGFTAAPTGTKPTVTLTNDATSTYAISANTCATTGTNASGQCTVTFTSPTAGTVTGSATATFSVGGISLTRATDSTHGSSGTTTKVFIAGSLKWSKDDNAGNLLGGATFQVCRTLDRFGAAVTGECVSILDNTGQLGYSGPDSDAAAGKFQLDNLKLGHYTVNETAAPAGWAPDPSTKSADLTLAAPNATISVHFVNGRPIVKITGFGYTNAPVGTPTSGVTHGTAVFTARLHNYGSAATVFSGTLVVTSNTVAGTLSCTGGNTLTFTNVALAAGADSAAITISCEYNVADGEKVTGTLNVSETLNGLPRVASGSPATITFTAQGD